jgi:hypothetical protein
MDQSERPSVSTILARVHFRGITAACVSITGEIITAHPSYPKERCNEVRSVSEGKAVGIRNVERQRCGTFQCSKFVGVYSGRVIWSEPLDAQLSLMCPATYLGENCAGQNLDTNWWDGIDR